MRAESSSKPTNPIQNLSLHQGKTKLAKRNTALFSASITRRASVQSSFFFAPLAPLLFKMSCSFQYSPLFSRSPSCSISPGVGQGGEDAARTRSRDDRATPGTGLAPRCSYFFFLGEAGPACEDRLRNPAHLFCRIFLFVGILLRRNR
jgi:hypothetical protein